MGRSVPWDDQWDEERREAADAAAEAAQAAQRYPTDLPEARSVEKDLTRIAKSFAQGFGVGSLSGCMFGLADVMMDTTAMSAGRVNHAPGKMLRFGGVLGGFLSAYYGFGRTLKLYNPYTPAGVDKDGANEVAAGAIAITPMVFYRPLRRYLPYAALLLAFDAFTGK
jgi:hypothetical protein